MMGRLGYQFRAWGSEAAVELVMALLVLDPHGRILADMARQSRWLLEQEELNVVMETNPAPYFRSAMDTGLVSTKNDGQSDN